MGLECFVCSELDSIPCPDSNSDYNSWKADTQKYVSHDPATSTDGLSCGIIIGGKTCLEDLYLGSDVYDNKAFLSYVTRPWPTALTVAYQWKMAATTGC